MSKDHSLKGKENLKKQHSNIQNKIEKSVIFITEKSQLNRTFLL